MSSHASQPPFAGNINFNAQHAPAGAFMSFTCGHFGSRGGFGLQIGKPGNQDLYVGVKDGGRRDAGALRCLPFFRRGAAAGGAGAADFLVEQAGPAEQNAASAVSAYAADRIRRRYGWATDAWETDDFSFALYTPFVPIPDPERASPAEMRDAIAPAIVGELTIDNTRGVAAKTGFLALNFNESGWLPLQPATRFSAGFSHRGVAGVLGEVIWDDGHGARQTAAPELFCRWTVDGGLAEPVPHLLGSCPGLAFEVPAGERRTLRVALGCFLPGIVTTGIESRYLYTRYFSSLTDVLTRSLARADVSIDDAEEADRRLRDSRLSPDQQFLIAHATRSYYGSTQLLEDGGRPRWVVNEGEYCMMNTLDLSVDQMFWELDQNPWVVRNLLEQFVDRYSYVDEVKVPVEGHTAHANGNGRHVGMSDAEAAGKPRVLGHNLPMDAFELRPGGVSFTHDMGAHNNFSPRGHSSYELPDVTGCFSYMTAEQLCNWSLMAATYVARTGDLDWARQHAHTLAACVRSLAARGGANGVVRYDSSRCATGSEITTYDSLDHSLAQTRDNVYVAVKAWASHVGLAAALDAAGGDAEAARLARDRAESIADAVAAHAGADGVIPAIFEADNPGHASRILPAAEALIYALDWSRTDAFGPAARAMLELPNARRMTGALERHTRALLTDPRRRNLFDDGGIKLSSTSNNSWMSKIALIQHVARVRFGAAEDAGLRKVMADADAAHVRWQTDGSSYWACCDQIVSGEAKGSRYYPRVITAALWLDGPIPEAPRREPASPTVQALAASR